MIPYFFIDPLQILKLVTGTGQTLTGLFSATASIGPATCAISFFPNNAILALSHKDEKYSQTKNVEKSTSMILSTIQ